MADINIPTEEQKTSDFKELELFLDWQKIYEERISRLLILAVGISLFYLYFVFLTPYNNEGRIAELKSLKQDLKILTNDYLTLQNTYENFASPKEAFPHPFINNTLIPYLENSVKTDKKFDSSKEKSSPQINSEQKLISGLKEDIKALTNLYTERRNKFSNIQTSPSVLQSNSQIEGFREALGTLFNSKDGIPNPQETEAAKVDENIKEINRKSMDNEAIAKLRMLLINGDETIKIPDDPASNLRNLAALEGIIRNLNDFERKEANIDFARKAGREINKESNTNSVRIGDSITQTILYDKYFGKNTPQDYKSKLSFVKNKGINSYNEIVFAVQPPFEVETVSDLIKLQDYSSSLLSKTISENQNSVLTLPIVNINIDRSAVVLGLPIFILFLIYTVRVYSERMTALISRVNEDKNSRISAKDFLNNSPLHLFSYSASLINVLNVFKRKRGETPVASTSDTLNKKLKDILALLFFPVLTVPLFTGLACVFYNRPNQSNWFVILKIFVGVIFIILSYAEIYFIAKNIRSLGRMTEY